MWSYYEHATNFKMSTQYSLTLKTVYINKLIIKLFLNVLNIQVYSKQQLICFTI